MNTEESSYQGMLKMIYLELKIIFGIFGRASPPFPHYMNFLNLADIHDWLPVNRSLRKIDRILKRNPKKRLKRAIFTLLRPLNWRPHLVACIAIVKVDREMQQFFVPVLWKKLEENGSWASPQILALLSIIDEDFINNCSENFADEYIIPQNYKDGNIDEFLTQLNEGNDKWIVYIEWRLELIELIKYK